MVRESGGKARIPPQSCDTEDFAGANLARVVTRCGSVALWLGVTRSVWTPGARQSKAGDAARTGTGIPSKRGRLRSTLGREPFPCAFNPKRGARPTTEMEPGAILTLTFPRCGEGFPSAMQMNPLTFDAIRLESMIERCSVSAHAFGSRRVDYFFAVEDCCALTSERGKPPQGMAKSEQNDESRVAGGIPGPGIFCTHCRSLAFEELRCIAKVRFEFKARKVG